MKKNLCGSLILLLGSMIYTSSFAQTKTVFNYANQWKIVDSLNNWDQPKSSLEIVEKILTAAKTNNNGPQIIRAVLEKVRIQNQIDHTSVTENLKDLENESRKLSFPENAILQSVLAQAYEGLTYSLPEGPERAGNYYRIDSLYARSLISKNALFEIPVKNYLIILDTAEGSEILRPSLYDLLAHRALNYYLTRAQQSSADVDFLNNPELFGASEDFLKSSAPGSNPDNPIIKAFHLYKELTQIHLNDARPDPLVFVEVERLNFIHSISVLKNKDQLINRTYSYLSNKYKSGSAGAYILASHSGFIFINFKNQKIRALEMARRAQALAPESPGGRIGKVLIQQIEAKHLSVNIEQYNLPDKAFLAKIGYQNIDTVYWRIHKIKASEFNYSTIQESQKIKFHNLPAHRIGKSYLPSIKDYNERSCEIKLDALGTGFYVISFSADKDFIRMNDGNDQILLLNITNISLIQLPPRDTFPGIYVVDATKGNSLPGASVKLYVDRNGTPEQIGAIRSDKNGYVPFSLKNLTYITRREITYKNDHRIDFQYQDFYVEHAGSETHMKFFTDRAIYRPGQTISFKGLLYTQTNPKLSNQVKANTEVVVYLYDVNHKVIADKIFVTNEFGSIQGSFLIPASGLAGTFMLNSSYGSQTFQVEEYKRPRFEVTINKTNTTYQAGDFIPVNGIAKSFAGNVIDNAKVRFTVNRRVYRGWEHSGENVISTAETKTNKNGEFVFEFAATPVYEKENEEIIIWYSVKVDVTDKNGETQSAENTIRVSSKLLKLSIEIQENYPLNLPFPVKLSVTNQDGAPVKTTGRVLVEQLEIPEINFRNKLWETADTALFSQAEHYRLFPNDPYMGQNDPAKWKVYRLVYDKAFRASDTLQILHFDKITPEAGKYKITIEVIDASGNSIKEIKYFTLYENFGQKPVPGEILSIVPLEIKSKYEPGEIAKFFVSSINKNSTIILFTYRNNKRISSETIQLNGKGKVFEIPVTEQMRGNFSVHVSMILNNSFYNKQLLIHVPWTNKQLTLKLKTFRNKTEPGSKETWTMTLTGPNSSKVKAEILAGMYDASLDQFATNSFLFNVWPEYNYPFQLVSPFQDSQSNSYQGSGEYFNQNFSEIKSYLIPTGYYGRRFRGSRGDMIQLEMASDMSSGVVNKASSIVRSNQKSEAGNQVMEEKASINQAAPNITLRRNFNETSFFYPQILFDNKDSVSFSFTLPEALTTWKFMSFAHTADLKTGYLEEKIISSKELMVQPDIPRFLREGDEIILTGKIVNMGKKETNGSARLELIDVSSGKSIGTMMLDSSTKSWKADASRSAAVSWKIKVPFGVELLRYRITAYNNQVSDGEEILIPVLPSKIFLTESLPLTIIGKGERTFDFTALKNSASSTTIEHEKLTLEFTSNPAWYAVQSLPYLIDNPYEGAEQLFSKYYANSTAAYIANSNPKIREIFDQWKQRPESFLSSLEKNPELKSIILEHSPWLAEGNSETERLRRTGELFDANAVKNNAESSLNKLIAEQLPSGAWSWYKSIYPDRYITQHIVTGFGKLIKSGIVRNANIEFVKKAFSYMDAELKKDYDELLSRKVKMDQNNLSEIHIQYFYARSFYPDLQVPQESRSAYTYYLSQMKSHWMKRSLQSKGMVAISLFRLNDKKTANDVMTSITQYSLRNPDMGLYWAENTGGYSWYQAPVETQSLLIEAYSEIKNDRQAVEEMKIWLLRQKQVQGWKSTKATADACYALLMKGTDLLASNEQVEIIVGKIKVESIEKPEAGTVYIKTAWNDKEVKPEMSSVTLRKQSDGLSWGAIHWQYFEQIDKVKSSSGPLVLSKQLFVKDNAGSWREIVAGSNVNQGDILLVKINISSDRDMEYMHLRDLRGSGLEPKDVISQYNYSGNLGFYQSTRDASTDFFISRLPKGNHIIQYELKVAQKGTYSNGFANLQSMYAPEFNARSAGYQLIVH